MKIGEIRSAPAAELTQKLVELKKELMKANAQIAVGTALSNPGNVRVIKRTIARIMGHLAQPVSASQPVVKPAVAVSAKLSTQKKSQKTSSVKSSKEGSSKN